MNTPNPLVDTPLPTYYQWIGNELNINDKLVSEYNEDLEKVKQ